MDIFTEKLYSFLKDKIKVNQEENKMSEIKTFDHLKAELVCEDPYVAYALETVGYIVAYRDRLGWNKKKLAEEAGVPLSLVLNIENGKIIPEVDVLNKLMKAVGFEWGYNTQEEGEE
jgi:ribosome-binding protein aMBF1 (putative translation factor)